MYSVPVIGDDGSPDVEPISPSGPPSFEVPLFVLEDEPEEIPGDDLNYGDPLVSQHSGTANIESLDVAVRCCSLCGAAFKSEGSTYKNKSRHRNSKACRRAAERRRLEAESRLLLLLRQLLVDLANELTSCRQKLKRRFSHLSSRSLSLFLLPKKFRSSNISTGFHRTLVARSISPSPSRATPLSGTPVVQPLSKCLTAVANAAFESLEFSAASAGIPSLSWTQSLKPKLYRSAQNRQSASCVSAAATSPCAPFRGL